MTHPTLVLNADAQPVSVVPLSTSTWQESIKLMYIDRADIVAEYADWQVHSPSMTMNVPSIIMMRDYIKVRRTIKFSKENIYLRDRYTCQYCLSDYSSNVADLTMDHVIPRFLGGLKNFGNIVASCMSCNLEKAHFMRMKPKNQPRRPTYWELAAIQKSMPIIIPDESWKDYIGWPDELIKVVPPYQKKTHPKN